jgi:hypothetical protein
MPCMTYSLIRADAPSVFAAAASAIARVCSIAVCTCSATPLADAALVLGLRPLDAKSLGGHSRSQALVYSVHAALVSSTELRSTYRPCAVWVPALGERAPALDQVVDCAASETCSEEGFKFGHGTQTPREIGPGVLS